MDPLEFRMKNDPHPIRQYQDEGRREALRVGQAQGERQRTRPAQARDRRRVRAVGRRAAAAAPTSSAASARTARSRSATARRTSGPAPGRSWRWSPPRSSAFPSPSVAAFIGDTNDPIGPGSGGSTTAPTLMPVARQAAFQAGRQLRQLVAEKWGMKPNELAFAGGAVRDSNDPQKSMSWADACRLIPGRRDLGARQASGELQQERRLGRLPDGDRRRALRRGRSRHRDRPGPRDALPRDAGRGDDHQSALGREPGERRHHPGHLLRAVRGAPPRPPEGPAW